MSLFLSSATCFAARRVKREEAADGRKLSSSAEDGEAEAFEFGLKQASRGGHRSCCDHTSSPVERGSEPRQACAACPPRSTERERVTLQRSQEHQSTRDRDAAVPNLHPVKNKQIVLSPHHLSTLSLVKKKNCDG